MNEDMPAIPSPPPDDDYGRIRIRRDFGPLQIGLRPILPSPFHDFTFTSLTGWRYHPSAPFSDRLGSSRNFQEKPSTEIGIPESWKQQQDQVEFTRNQLAGLETDETSPKRPRLDYTQQTKSIGSSSSTAVTQSTNGSLSLSSSSASTPLHQQQQRQQPNSIELAKHQEQQRIPFTNPAAPAPANATISNNPHPLNTPTLPKPAVSGVVPKAALYVFYGKKPRRVQLSGNAYVTWDNQLQTHEVKYTSAFICPITKEVFLSGHYGDAYKKDGCLVWYTKKALAEHAAAARALDCWNWREPTGNSGERLGQDDPYLKGQAPIDPSTQIPPSVLVAIREAQGSGTSNNGIRSLPVQQTATAAAVAQPAPTPTPQDPPLLTLAHLSQNTSSHPSYSVQQPIAVSASHGGGSNRMLVDRPPPPPPPRPPSRWDDSNSGRATSNYISGLPPGNNWSRQRGDRPAWQRDQEHYRNGRNNSRQDNSYYGRSNRGSDIAGSDGNQWKSGNNDGYGGGGGDYYGTGGDDHQDSQKSGGGEEW